MTTTMTKQTLFETWFANTVKYGDQNLHHHWPKVEILNIRTPAIIVISA